MYLRAQRLLEGLTPDAALKRRTSRTSPFLDFFSCRSVVPTRPPCPSRTGFSRRHSLVSGHEFTRAAKPLTSLRAGFSRRHSWRVLGRVCSGSSAPAPRQPGISQLPLSCHPDDHAVPCLLRLSSRRGLRPEEGSAVRLPSLDSPTSVLPLPPHTS